MPDNPLHAYNHYSRRAASIVIREYSTSFSLASCLLRGRVRHDICNLYAVVRIADEVVDGVAAAAGLDTNAISAELDGFEQQVFRATRTGFSTNPAVHAFASTVHRCRISEEHIRAFFTSMRRDLDPTAYDQAALDDYIWGSAEVIGLMCLAIFTAERPLSPVDQKRCEEGARRLGAAFQKINFLRDVGDDTIALGRDYLNVQAEGEQRGVDKRQIVADITADLDAAYPSIALLPTAARAGVLAAYLIFRDLCARLDHMTMSEIMSTRVRVPAVMKARLVARACAQAPRLHPPTM